MISSGNNYPSLNIRANQLTEICVALHRRGSDSIERDLGISPAELRNRINSLVTAGLAEDRFGQFLPTFMVTLEDAKWMAPKEMVKQRGVSCGPAPDVRARADRSASAGPGSREMLSSS
jgi:hypothetical protein